MMAIDTIFNQISQILEKILYQMVAFIWNANLGKADLLTKSKIVRLQEAKLERTREKLPDTGKLSLQ